MLQMLVRLCAKGFFGVLLANRLDLEYRGDWILNRSALVTSDHLFVALILPLNFFVVRSNHNQFGCSASTIFTRLDTSAMYFVPKKRTLTSS